MNQNDTKKLSFQNDLGGFDLENNEYVIKHGGNLFTPRPWTNVISNRNFGTIVSESALGFSFFDNSKEKRIASWSNDPLMDTPSEVIYVRDNDTEKLWSTTRLPVGNSDTYLVRHGNGYSVYESTTEEIKQEMKVFVDIDEQVKLLSLELTNKSSKKRNLTLFYYIDVVMGGYKNQFDHFVKFWKDPQFDAVQVVREDKREWKKRVFFSSSEEIEDWTTSKNLFVGYSGTLADPHGIKSLETDDYHTQDNCVVLKVSVEIEPNETKWVSFITGTAIDDEGLKVSLDKYRKKENVEFSLQKVKDFWHEMNSHVQISTPDKTLDVLVNQWLIYQILSCRMWGRTSFFQSGGAYGFRDQLQDCMSFVFSHPEICRSHILTAAARQFEEGDVQHWWFPDSGLGVRNKVADSPLWIPYVTYYYVERTGDTSIFEEEIPYLKGRPLTDDLKAYVDVPQISEIRETLWQHCMKAINKVSQFGVHGLPLIKEGDWNDGMNAIGEEGKGESIWIGWFLGTVLRHFIPVAEQRNDTQSLEKLKALSELLKDSMHNNAWDGEWYLRAYFDDGKKLGSKNSGDCKIDSISQSWAVLSEMDDHERAQRGIDSALKFLFDTENNLVKLLDPAFDKDQVSPGYIKDYVPGIRENGGQYNHAVYWLSRALAKLKRGDEAVKILNCTNPIKRSATIENIWQYELEPYVVGGDVYTSAQHIGKGGWGWYTGSAGWMYRTIIESILGLKVLGDKVRLDPAVPLDWQEYSIEYKHKSSKYKFYFQVSPGHSNSVGKVNVDGHDCFENTISLVDDGKNHVVWVYVS